MSDPLPISVCPECGYRMEAATGLTMPDSVRDVPRDGDVTLCLNCGEILLFGPELRADRPDDAQTLALMASELWPGVVAARNAIRARGPLPRMSKRR